MFSCEICKIFKNTFFTEHLCGCFLILDVWVLNTVLINPSFPMHPLSSCLEVFLKFSENSHENTCPGFTFYTLIKLQALSFYEKWLHCRCVSVNFMKFLIKPFWQNTSRQILLFYLISCLESFLWFLKVRKLKICHAFYAINYHFNRKSLYRNIILVAIELEQG